MLVCILPQFHTLPTHPSCRLEAAARLASNRTFGAGLCHLRDDLPDSFHFLTLFLRISRARRVENSLIGKPLEISLFIMSASTLPPKTVKT